MANVYKEQEQLWQTVAQKKIGIPRLVWEYWDQKFWLVLKDIEDIIVRNPDQEISVEESRKIGRGLGDLTIFLHSIKKGEGRVRLEDGLLYVPMEIKELVGHYLGNDVFRMNLLMLDGTDFDPKPVSVENRNKMKKTIEEIRGFGERLKNLTKESI